MTTTRCPKIFISYTHDSDDHDANVRGLAARLVSDGVDCSLDQYVTSPPEGWPKWMDQEINKADYVLVICTETYNRRASGQEKDGKGLGGKWESYLAYQNIYNNNSMNRKFIPIILTGANKPHIPVPLTGATYYDISQPDGYDLLYRHLTNQPRVSKPPLGTIRKL